VAEGARLESVYTGNRIVGSNPTLSASLLGPSLRSGFRQRAPAPLRCAQARSRPLSASSSNPTLSARFQRNWLPGPLLRSNIRPYLPRLPMPRIAPAVKAGNHYNPMFLCLEEYPVGKAPHSRTATAAVDGRELQRMFRYCLNRGLHREGEALPKLWANVVIPCPRFLQILVRLRYPDDRQRHGFLNRPALTCSQEMTSEGFCSCRARR
jgi:hypothetical protein